MGAIKVTGYHTRLRASRNERNTRSTAHVGFAEQSIAYEVRAKTALCL